MKVLRLFNGFDVKWRNDYPFVLLGIYTDIAPGYRAKWVFEFVIAFLFWRATLEKEGPLRNDSSGR